MSKSSQHQILCQIQMRTIMMILRTGQMKLQISPKNIMHPVVAFRYVNTIYKTYVNKVVFYL